ALPRFGSLARLRSRREPRRCFAKSEAAALPIRRVAALAATALDRKGAAQELWHSVLPPSFPPTAAAAGATALQQLRHKQPGRPRFQITRCPESPAPASRPPWNRSFLPDVVGIPGRGSEPIRPVRLRRWPEKSVPSAAVQRGQNDARSAACHERVPS